MVKKIMKILLITLVVLIVAAFAIPFLFKDRIVLKIQTEINKNINAKVAFKDVNVSLLRHFPRLSAGLQQLRVTGINGFERDTLIAADNVDVSLDLISVIIGDNMKIYSVTLESPRIHAIVNKEGHANWDIVKADSSATDTADTSKPFSVELKQYTISNGYISYIDRQSNMNAEIIGLNHEGSGDFTSDIFILKTATRSPEVNFSYNNIPYLAHANVVIDADVQINNKISTYLFETDQINVNNLKLATKGLLQSLPDSSYKMDISFNAPSNDFKSILSLIPAIYQNDFNKVKTSGNVVFNGFVKGIYNSRSIPAYSLNLDIKNGFFQYPDLPKPVKNINLSLKIDNPDGVTDHTVVNMPQAHLEMDNEPFDLRLLVKNPKSDLFIDGAAKGKINLSDITQFVKLQPGTKLSGKVQADVSVKGTMAAIEQQRYEQFAAAGTIGVSGLQYASSDYPDGVKINNLFMTFNPRDIIVSDLDGRYKNTNFTANGSVSNALPYMLRGKPLGGTLQVKADKMNLNEWMGTSTDTATKNTAAAAPFAVPANINFVVDASIARLLYDKLEMQQVSGKMVMQDERVQLNNIGGDALEGSILINGSYSTKNSKTKPDIALDYDVKGLNIEKTFYTFNTVQKLMPIGQYLSGKMSSQLKMTGKLGDNMMPDLASLTGKGNLLLIEGFLKKFAPLDKLAEMLNVNELKEISLREVKNYIEFNNGKVLVKPFTIKVKDIEMEIGGLHGFDQSLDYVLNIKLPRALMGEKGNSLVNNLITAVNNKGIPVKLGETVNLQVNLGGTIKSPSFKMDLKEAGANLADQLKQQALTFAQSKIDSTRAAFKDTAASVRKQLEKGIQQEISNRLFGNKDSTKPVTGGFDSSRKQIENAGKGFLRGLLKKKPADTAR